MSPPTSCAATTPGTEAGAIPASVFENIRPTVMAGLAKLMELVNQYAAPMYAPTAAGAVDARPVRASEKMTSSRPSVEMTSANRWAGLARWWVEMLIALSANMAPATVAPLMQPATWAGMYW